MSLVFTRLVEFMNYSMCVKGCIRPQVYKVLLDMVPVSASAGMGGISRIWVLSRRLEGTSGMENIGDGH